MRWWRVAFDEKDDESRKTAMSIMRQVDALLDAFHKQDIAPTPGMVQDALQEQGVDVQIKVDSEGYNVVFPKNL
jgi:hypothetical protein